MLKGWELKILPFFDDALLVDPQRHIIPILELLLRKAIHPRFHTPNGVHPKYIRPTASSITQDGWFSER